MPLYSLLHSLLNALVAIANKMGLQRNCFVFGIPELSTEQQPVSFLFSLSRSQSCIGKPEQYPISGLYVCVWAHARARVGVRVSQ
jgi:hypothetical protein